MGRITCVLNLKNVIIHCFVGHRKRSAFVVQGSFLLRNIIQWVTP